MSAALASVSGTAHAAPSAWSFTSEDGSSPTKTVPAGTCAVDWTLIGAGGGTERRVTTKVREGDILTLVPGQPFGSSVDPGVYKDFAVVLSAAGVGSGGGTMV